MIITAPREEMVCSCVLRVVFWVAHYILLLLLAAAAGDAKPMLCGAVHTTNNGDA